MKIMRKIFLATLFLIISSVMVQRVFADGPGDLDRSFGRDGRERIDISDNSYDRFAKMVTQGSKFFVLGQTTGGNPLTNNPHIAVMKYREDGRLDETFSEDGKVITDLSPSSSRPYQDYGRGIAIQSDGKIIVTGESYDRNASGDNIRQFVLRYTVSGELDRTFGTGGVVWTSIEGGERPDLVKVLSTGKILVAGWVEEWVGGRWLTRTKISLTRYLPSGDLDSSFGDGGIGLFDIGCRDCRFAVQNNGKILAVGNMSMTRINANGRGLDTSCGGDGSIDISYDTRAAAIQSSGNILIVSGSDLRRYSVGNCDLDVSFGSRGSVDLGFLPVNNVQTLLVDNDDKIIVGGWGGSEGFVIARLSPTGDRDRSFGGDGIVTSNFNYDGNSETAAGVYGLAIFSGKLLAAGEVHNGEGELGALHEDIALARYDYDSPSAPGRSINLKTFKHWYQPKK